MARRCHRLGQRKVGSCSARREPDHRHPDGSTHLNWRMRIQPRRDARSGLATASNAPGGMMVRHTLAPRRGFIIGALVAVLSATSGVPALVVPRAAAAEPIGHVIVIIQENHSFDNLFGDFPGAN